MIARLTGKKAAVLPTGIILDVNGVGYFLELPLSTLCQLPEGDEPLELYTHTYVRQDIIKLYGFGSLAEKNAFEILISLNGIGPKVALAILSTLSLKALKLAVRQQSQQAFEAVPGIGKRLAEKILVELKPKLAKLEDSHIGSSVPSSTRATGGTANGSAHGGSMGNAAQTPLLVDSEEELIDYRGQLIDDALSALLNLGFKEKQVLPVVTELLDNNPNFKFEQLVRQSLIALASPHSSAQQSAAQQSAAQKAKAEHLQGIKPDASELF